MKIHFSDRQIEYLQEVLTKQIVRDLDRGEEDKSELGREILKRLKKERPGFRPGAFKFH